MCDLWWLQLTNFRSPNVSWHCWTMSSNGTVCSLPFKAELNGQTWPMPPPSCLNLANSLLLKKCHKSFKHMFTASGEVSCDTRCYTTVAPSKSSSVMVRKLTALLYNSMMLCWEMLSLHRAGVKNPAYFKVNLTLKYAFFYASPS